MKIAISNIAWHMEEEESIACVMEDLGVTGVEIAPTKIWSFPLAVSKNDIKSYQKFWQNKGIEIISLQALLFGKPDLKIFSNSQNRQETFNYLCGMIELASKLEAKVLVFGSPKNRTIGDLDLTSALEIAQEFFFNLGEFAVKNGVIFCIEPNPNIYGCDFITNSNQGLDLVKKVNSQGFRLHLDSAGMTLSDEDIKSALTKSIAQLCHFHLSEPYLGQVGDGEVNHQLFTHILSDLNYQQWVSIEMKAQHPVNNIPSVTKAIKSIYNSTIKP